MKKFFTAIFKENPVFVLLLGLCPVLAISTTFESAYLMGTSVLIVLILSNIIISLTAKYIPKNIMIPSYIMIIATLVTILGLLISKYLPDVNAALGIYIPLIVVNCIILGRAIEVASKGKILKSIKDAFTSGIGFLFAIVILGIIREFLGTGTLTVFDKISTLTGFKMIFQVYKVKDIMPISFFVTPAGAFVTLGLILALINYIKIKRSESKWV